LEKALTDDDIRLAVLDDYQIVNTADETQFDDIVFLASTICETPVALISLVERDRQWFKARVGFEACETPIEQSVCRHALASTDLLVIPDLTADARTRHNTLVSEGPMIRFYAGAPLVTPQGVIIGTLCVIDQVARPAGLSETQEHALTALARQVMLLMEARRDTRRRIDLYMRQKNVNAQLRARERSSVAAQEAGGIGTFEVDVATGTMLVSKEFCRIFDIPISPRYPASFLEAMVLPEDIGLASNSQNRQDGTAAASTEYRIVTPHGEIRWIARDATFSPATQDQPARMQGTVQDITESKLADAQQLVINRELSHRMKNTLAIVQALASQSLKGIADRQQVMTFEQRLRALGTAHDVLLQQSRNAAPVAEIVAQTMGNLGVDQWVKARGPDVEFGPKSTLTLSLLLHELCTNAMKHGALARGGNVEIFWKVTDGGDSDLFTLAWRELGGGPAQTPSSRGFGSRLIAMGLGTNEVKTTYDLEGFYFETSAPYSFLRQPD
jgi:two-component sensor histidine kinase/PAS domain-containing protein